MEMKQLVKDYTKIPQTTSTHIDHVIKWHEINVEVEN